jgi:retron-type reverse transcriptase
LPERPKPRRIASSAQLREVWRQSRDAHGRGSAPGCDGVTPRRFKENIQRNIDEIHHELMGGNYHFGLLRAFPIPKANGKIRMICAPTVRDRLVQRLLCEHLLAGDKLGVSNTVSFGFVRDGGVPKAVKEAKKIRQHQPWILKSDISAFFDRIDRNRLANALGKKIGRSSIFPLLSLAIECEVDESPPWTATWLRDAGIVRGEGLRQGMPLSPLLSNFVLKKFDRHFERRQIKLVRYADDFVIFARSEAECQSLFAEARAVLLDLGHDIPDPGANSKTVISPPDMPIEFLGYEIAVRATGGYRITVPKHAFDTIKGTLAKYHDLDAAIAKFKTLDRLMQSLSSIARSFAAVYYLGDNHAALESHVNNCRGRAVMKIAEQLFGPDVLKRMDDRKKAFLGLALLPLESEW